MTMRYELDETELRSHDGTLPRDRDPVVPRGAVVAGKDRAVEEPDPLGGGEEKKGELPVVGYRAVPPDPATEEALAGVMLYPGSDRDEACIRYATAGWKVEPLSLTLPAQERIRALEEERDRLAERLERLRPVVRAAVAGGLVSNPMNLHILYTSVDDLTPDDRQWAEGEE